MHGTAKYISSMEDVRVRLLATNATLARASCNATKSIRERWKESNKCNIARLGPFLFAGNQAGSMIPS